MTPFDATIVGGGPAGLSAAIWLGRHRRRTLLIDAGEHRNRWVDHAHGYLGRDPLDPGRLVERAREDLARYDSVEVRRERVLGAQHAEPDAKGPLFTLRTDHDELSTRRLILATGVVDAFPDVRNFFDHYGADVFHCPVCDGFETRGKPVVVFGWAEHVVDFALGLLEWASSVTVVTDGHRLHAPQPDRERLRRAGITVVEDEAEELCGPRGGLRAVRLRSQAELPCQAAFFAIAHRPVTELARALGCALTEEGYVGVDETACTSVPGVWAAGDLTPGVQLIQVAAAKGTIAGVACARSLSR